MLFPAHAGVIPADLPDDLSCVAFPRTRGGDPKERGTWYASFYFSPHTRG